MNIQCDIITDRFQLRELVEEDATERYLSWFGDSKTKKFISSASKTKNLSDLKHYINERSERSDVLFLGIFEKNNGLHIGNIKYEPINTKLGYAIMGILIGDNKYRGKGVGKEVLQASAHWLKKHCKIKQIVLGVSSDNPAAIRSYEKTGFLIEDTPYIPKSSCKTITMVWYL